MIIDYSNYENLQIVGDIHGIIELTNFINSINVKNTLFICTGDIGLGKDSYTNDLDALIKLEYKLLINNNIFCIIRGNHDNPKYFKKTSSFRNDLSEESEHIIVVPDNTIIKTSKYTILCIGGARSIDRTCKIRDVNYWQNECVQRPTDDFYKSIENNKLKIDIIVSHTAPLFAMPHEFTNENKYYNSYLLNSWAMYDKTVKNDIYKERLLLKSIYEKLNIKNKILYWFYGHYHISNESYYGKSKIISLNTLETKIIS